MGTNMVRDSTEDKDAGLGRCEEAEGTDVATTDIILEFSADSFEPDVTVSTEYGTPGLGDLRTYMGDDGGFIVRLTVHYFGSEDPGPEAGDTEQGVERRTWELEVPGLATGVNVYNSFGQSLTRLSIQGPGRLTYEQFGVEESKEDPRNTTKGT